MLAHWTAPLDGPNTPQQNFIMQLSMARERVRPLLCRPSGDTTLTRSALLTRVAQGYFILDSIHVAAYGLDKLYLLHHAQTLTYMARPAPSGTRVASLARCRLPLPAR